MCPEGLWAPQMQMSPARRMSVTRRTLARIRARLTRPVKWQPA